MTGTQENAANLSKVREMAYLQQFILFLYYILQGVYLQKEIHYLLFKLGYVKHLYSLALV